ncbi:hypothetical protein FUA48_08650 [Flavobacterium alkalisoli]|uniref:Uncharacterized protein n=1 Tax=Flavobacterium alkalisoli TaxID=2602769 RepID=A0A5B9FRM6_9FLAO|nr:hypothetical protein [Flavobacterium alkalisoli]QEE49650.1 hypothetical protein FUA48_08650 [Flavobacterium alkalisoli]
MNLVQQNKTVERNLPAIAMANVQGLGLRIFGWTPPIGDWIAGAVRYVGGAIAGRVRSIPFVGRAIADEIDSLTELAAQVIETRFTEWGLNARVFDSEGNYIGTELTESEKQILEQWLAVFKPYAENLTLEVVNALALTDTNAMLTGINAVLNKINAIQDHYNPDVTKTPGLSDNALKQRSYVIYQAFSLIVLAITEGLKSKNLNLTTKQVSFPMNQYNFMPLFSSSAITSVTGENYVLAGSGTKPTKPIGGGTDLVTNVPGKVITEPVKVQPVNTGNTTTTNTGGTTTTDNTPATTAANETKKVPNWLWWVAGGALVYGISRARGSKKSKK